MVHSTNNPLQYSSTNGYSDGNEFLKASQAAVYHSRNMSAVKSFKSVLSIAKLCSFIHNNQHLSATVKKPVDGGTRSILLFLINVIYCVLADRVSMTYAPLEPLKSSSRLLQSATCK
jgi:hypothetical protein